MVIFNMIDDSGEDSDFVEEFQENGGGDIQHLSLNDPDDFDDGIIR